MLIEILILLFIIIIFYEIFNDSFNYYEGFAKKKKNKKSESSANPIITTVEPTTNVTTNEGENEVIPSTPPAPATSNDPMILSEKNAGQILLLKDQYNSQTKSINDIKNYMTKLFDNVETLNNQVEALKSNK